MSATATPRRSRRAADPARRRAAADAADAASRGRGGLVAGVRQVLFWMHLALGVAARAVILVMSATGVLLTYQKQMTTWADLRGLDGAPPAAAVAVAPLPLDSLVARARARVPSPAPTAVTWRADADAPVEVAFGRERRVFVNRYTGAVLGEGSARMRGFFREVTDWHRWLAAAGERRPAGKAITGAANLAFLFIVLSGIWLWWPRTRAALRSVVAFRRGLSGKARDFNWHNVIGAWGAIPLAIVVASATVISYPWASALVYRAYGETPPAPAAPRAREGGREGAGRDERAPSVAGLDALVARAQERMPGWRTVTLTLPTSDTAAAAFSLDRGMGGQPQHRAQLVLDRATGAERKYEGFADLTPARRARSVLRFAHTGEVLGVAGQTIAGLVSLGAVVLVYTGIALSLRRLAAWLGRRRRALA